MQITTRFEAEASLSALGFTETEAALYCALAASGPATAYRLAKLVGKAPANAYQALAALAHKGAVSSDEGDPRTYRATPPEQLLAGLGGEFDVRLESARQSLAGLATAAPDDRIYHLEGAAAVVERARAIVSSASQVVLFDLFPGPLDRLRPTLEAAAARGVIVAGLVYEQGVEIAGVDARRSPTAEFALERWPGAQLSLVADAAEHLVALMSPDLHSVRRAIWSDSAYLSCLQYSGLSAEIRLCDPASARSSAAALALLQVKPRGLQILVGPEPISTRSRNEETD